MRVVLLVLSFVFILGVDVPQANADFSFFWREDNYFLAEARAFNSLDLDKDIPADGVGNNRRFSTLKMRMKPTMSISDRLAVHAAFDVFVNPFATSSHEGGAIQGQQTPDVTQIGPVVSPNLPNTPFGGTTAYGRSAFTGTTLAPGSAGSATNFLVKEAFLEYISDWGVFKLGRIPRDWGIGINYHSGSNPTDKFSDRTDSIFYELSLGNFKLAGIFSKILENGLDSGSDDTSMYETYLHWNEPEKDMDFGILYAYLKNPASFVKLSTVDIFYTKRYTNFEGGIEGVFTLGDPGFVSGNSAQAWGLAVQAKYNWTPSFDTYAKGGYASGPEIGNPAELTLFAFNRNYDIALMMFNQGLGAIAVQTGVSAMSNPDANAISNAIYANVGANYALNDRIGFNFNYATATAVEALTGGGETFYGQEVDLGVWYQFVENLRINGETGIFVPGNLYKGIPGLASRKTDWAFAFYAGATLLF